MKSARCLEMPGTDCTATRRRIPEQSSPQIVLELKFAHKWTDTTAYRKLFHLWLFVLIQHNHVRASWWFCHIPRGFFFCFSLTASTLLLIVPGPGRRLLAVTALVFCVVVVFVCSWSAEEFAAGLLQLVLSLTTLVSRGKVWPSGVCDRQCSFEHVRGEQMEGILYAVLTLPRKILVQFRIATAVVLPSSYWRRATLTLFCTHECLCRRHSLIWMTEYIVFRHKFAFFVFHDLVFEHVWWLNDAVS